MDYRQLSVDNKMKNYMIQTGFLASKDRVTKLLIIL